MDYVRQILTEKSVYTEANQTVSIIPITKGRIVDGWIYFPSGPAGTLHVIVRRGIHQLLPVDPGNNYALDDCVIAMFGNLEINQPPLNLKIVTWNTSTLYDHTLTLCVFLNPWSDPRTPKTWLSKFRRKNG